MVKNTPKFNKQMEELVRKWRGDQGIVVEKEKRTPEQEAFIVAVQAKYDALKEKTTEDLYARGESLLFKVYHAKREVNMIRNLLINRGGIRGDDLTEYADSIPEDRQQIPMQEF